MEVLSLKNRNNFSDKLYIPAKALQSFEIGYTHSVNKGRIYDFYIVKDQPKGTFLLDKTTFVSYGAGILEPSDLEGSVFEQTDDGYVMKNLRLSMDSLQLGVGTVAEHSLKLNYITPDGNTNSIEYELKKLFPPKTGLILEIKRVNLFDYIFNKLN